MLIGPPRGGSEAAELMETAIAAAEAAGSDGVGARGLLSYGEALALAGDVEGGEALVLEALAARVRAGVAAYGLLAAADTAARALFALPAPPIPAPDGRWTTVRRPSHPSEAPHILAVLGHPYLHV